MKRIIGFMFALIFVLSIFSLVSCGKVAEKITAYSLVATAIDKTNSLKDVDSVMDANIAVSSQGVTINIPTTIAMKAKNVDDEENSILYIDMSMQAMGMDLDVEAYKEGEYFYVTMLGASYKVKADSAGDEFLASDDMEDMMKVIPEVLLADTAIIDNDDGSRSVELNMEADSFSEIYGAIVESAVEAASLSVGEISNAEVTDCYVKVTVDENGYVVEYTLQFDIDMTATKNGESVDVSIDYDAIITFNDPGSIIEITPPENYQDFEEFDTK